MANHKIKAASLKKLEPASLWIVAILALAILEIPKDAEATSTTAYNLTQYNSSLIERISLPTRWTPEVATIGYHGALDVMWYVSLSGIEDSALISSEDAKKKGAPSDYVLLTGPDNCWGMLMNFGLVSLGQNSDLVVSISADPTQSSSLAPAFALYQGWDTGSSSTRHQTITFGANNPLSTTGLSFIGDAYANNASNTVTRTFHNLAAGNYEIFVTNRSNNSNSGGYSVSLQTLPAGTGLDQPVSQSDLCASSNNKRFTTTPSADLCVFGAPFAGLGGQPIQMPDGRYRWGCGRDAATNPQEMCYTLSAINSKQNQAPILLQPGSTKAPVNGKVIEEASGGSGAGTMTFTVPSASMGIKCKLVKKGRTATITAGPGQTGSCVVRATKAASAKFNSVQSVDYTIKFGN